MIDKSVWLAKWGWSPVDGVCTGTVPCGSSPKLLVTEGSMHEELAPVSIRALPVTGLGGCSPALTRAVKRGTLTWKTTCERTGPSCCWNSRVMAGKSRPSMDRRRGDET